jgi:glycosyltransferase involved in cell wall biosynthesis
MIEHEGRIKILYLERKFNEFFSIEKVFRQIARGLSKETFETSFQQTGHISSFFGIIKNLATFKPIRADIYHITGHINYIALLLPSKRTVLTVHDTGLLLVRKGIRRLILKKLLFDLPIRKAKFITAVSEKTKNDIVKLTDCDSGKIRVIENPLDDSFLATEKAGFNAECPQILQVGTAPHKNLSNVIKAVEGLNCSLVIIGKLDDATQFLLSERKINYRSEAEIDDDALRQFYHAADLVVFCSTFEGFGLPIIEAQAMKTPVVTSNIEPMKEVAGDGALLVNPHDHLEIREAIKKIIGDNELRESLVSKGTENVKRYATDVVAEKYALLYREVIENKET